MNPYRCVVISSLVLASAASAGAQRRAEPGFNGTWKLNLAKSQLSGMVYTFEKKPSGQWHYSGGGFDADFDLAGKQFIMPNGVGVTGKEASPTAWDLTFSMAGKVTTKAHVTVKGDSLLWANENIGADGKSIRQTNTDSRISGGPGFAGKWKAGRPSGSTSSMRINVQGNDITVSAPEFRQSTKGSFDGKDYPSTQAGQPTKITSAFTKAGSNAINVTTKIGGKPYSSEVWTLSADGKVMTIESTFLATKEKQKSVFERV
jgi:hypothetical protein